MLCSSPLPENLFTQPYSSLPFHHLGYVDWTEWRAAASCCRRTSLHRFLLHHPSFTRVESTQQSTSTVDVTELDGALQLAVAGGPLHRAHGSRPCRNPAPTASQQQPAGYRTPSPICSAPSTLPSEAHALQPFVHRSTNVACDSFTQMTS